MFKKPSIVVTALATALLIVACAGQKGPADQAVKAAEAALAAVKEDAAKYVPSDLSAVEGSLTALKDNFTKGDYKAVLAGAGALTTQIGALKDAAAAKKTEMEAAIAKATSDWTGMAADLPNMVAAIQSRVDILGKAKKLPKGMDQAAFDGAKSGLDMMKTAWTEASAAATSGNYMDAVAKAQMVKDKGAEVMQALGMGG
jgi:hypothetical protein